VHLTVIGAGPAYTDRQGATGASYLVEAASTRLLLDLGQGSFPRIFERTDPAELDAVVVSHLHPDHFIDLVPLRHYLRWELHPPRRVRVLGPRDLAGRLDALHAEPGFAAQALDVEPLQPGSVAVGEMELEASLVAHTEESYAFRVSAGGGSPGLVYSGDCARAGDLAELLRPGDVLLSEVSFGPGPVPAGAMHLDGPAVGRLAADTHVSRVLLTHLQMRFSPESTVESVRAAYPGPVAFVWPGSSLEL
jgi:ribonuclease BN (tRNA processing enzyme)